MLQVFEGLPNFRVGAFTLRFELEGNVQFRDASLADVGRQAVAFDNLLVIR